LQLETPRLYLREYTAEDWPAVLAYQSDPRYLRYYEWEKRSPRDVRAFLKKLIEWQTARPRIKFQFAVMLRAEDRLIGSCGIRRQTLDAVEADIGYEIAPDLWGQGLATEAARALLAFGFDDLNVHRIWARCVAGNAASARVMEKVGMQYEGRMRENEWFKGRWWDTLIYGILEQEWRVIGNE